MLDFFVKTRARFSLRDKQLFEITEVEITRVACIFGFGASREQTSFETTFTCKAIPRYFAEFPEEAPFSTDTYERIK